MWGLGLGPSGTACCSRTAPVWGLGFRVQDSGFMVRVRVDLHQRQVCIVHVEQVQGLGFGDEGLGVRVSVYLHQREVRIVQVD